MKRARPLSTSPPSLVTRLPQTFARSSAAAHTSIHSFCTPSCPVSGFVLSSSSLPHPVVALCSQSPSSSSLVHLATRLQLSSRLSVSSLRLWTNCAGTQLPTCFCTAFAASYGFPDTFSRLCQSFRISTLTLSLLSSQFDLQLLALLTADGSTSFASSCPATWLEKALLPRAPFLRRRFAAAHQTLSDLHQYRIPGRPSVFPCLGRLLSASPL